jgi:hypothetical protein
MSTKCTAMTKKGTQCTKNAKEGTLCGVHSKGEANSSISGTSVKSKGADMVKCKVANCNEFTTITEYCYMHRPD